jgi:hypothetical protein
MPQPALSGKERRLATFSRFSAILYFLGAAAAPFASGIDRLSAILSASLLASLGTCCLVAAGRPRERRHALLPVIVAGATICALALALRQALNFAFLPAPLLLVVTLYIYGSAAPGVHSAPALEGPPPAPEEPADRKIQLGIKSS